MENLGLKQFSLEGKTVLVTGGGRGIGKAIALTMAQAGADVAVAARTHKEIEETAKEIQGVGRRSLAIKTDVSNSTQVDEMVSKASESLGRVDILVNNAGVGELAPVAHLPTPLDRREIFAEETSDEMWRRVIEVNLTSAFYCCRAVAPQMLKRRSGKVINVSSTDSIMAYPGGAAYNASKAAMNALTRTLAVEWAPYNINVNGIGPGWFITDMTREGFEDPEIRKYRLSDVPLGRLTDVQDLGSLAVYLASPAADWMTGQIIYLDGGESSSHT